MPVKVAGFVSSKESCEWLVHEYWTAEQSSTLMVWEFGDDAERPFLPVVMPQSFLGHMRHSRAPPLCTWSVVEPCVVPKLGCASFCVVGGFSNTSWIQCSSVGDAIIIAITFEEIKK